ncbi:MAG TPA: regulatory protein RecX [Tepidiformaceae bacterium]|nr:regulatory protein RecX [Tepidiformaceae bacterium]
MDDDPPSQPVIVTVRSTANGRQRLLSLSDGRELLFSDEACERAGIGEGIAATVELLHQLEEGEERVVAHSAALRLLSHRARSETEMRTRLGMRGVAPATIDYEIERLRQAGLLDDQKFAQSWVEDRKRFAPRGTRMLRYELLGRGIDPESIDNVTAGLDDRELALALAREKASKTKAETYEAFAGRIGGLLRRRGFDYDAVAYAVRTTWEERAAAARDAEGE